MSATAAKQSLPEYTVRISRRAKYVHLQITLHNGLEVVVPRGFDTGHVPQIIRDKRPWIDKATRRIERQREYLLARSPHPVPRRITLSGIDEEWFISYDPELRTRSAVHERPGGQLVVGRDAGQVEDCRTALRDWIKLRARRRLVPRLRHLSQELDLPYGRASIRDQRTIWASCSGRGNISINFKLLFLPRDLVDYVLIHELCHTRHLNHSRRFWQLVARHAPDYRQRDSALRDGWRHIPLWVES